MTIEQSGGPDEELETPQGVLRRFGRLIEYVPNDDARAPTREELSEQRERILARLEEARAKLDPLLDATDPLELLMQLAFLHAVFNPDEFKESDMELQPAFVEFLALQILPRMPVPSFDWNPSEIGKLLTETEELLEEIFSLRLFDLQLSIAVEGDLRPIDQTLRYEAISSSIVVRFPGWTHHMSQTFRGLYGPFVDKLRETLGFDLEEGLAMADVIPPLTVEAGFERSGSYDERVADLKKKVKRVRRRDGEADELIQALAGLRPSDALTVIQSIAVSWTFAGSRSLAAVTPEKVGEAAEVDQEKALAFLESMVVDPGSYNSRFHALPAPTHPLQSRPAIKDQDRFIFPVPLSAFYALPSVIEGALRDADLIEDYFSHRGKYLEAEATNLLADALDGAPRWTRLDWKSTSTDAQSELDGLIAYGQAGLRLQCKSGQLTPPARRGGLSRVTDDLEKLVGDALDQHGGLRDALARDGAEAIGLGEVKEALDLPLQLEVIVTLDDINPFGHEIFKLVDFGTISEGDPLPWVVSLSDLRIICDILSTSQLIHFLLRRARLNRVGRVYAPDEIDWLAHYLVEGLYFDEWLGDEGPDYIGLTSYTDEIDAWYLSELGIRNDPVDKPSQPMPSQMKHVIHQLEQQRPPGFLICCLLMLEWSWETRRIFGDNYVGATERSAVNGAADFSMMFSGAGYGFTYSTGRTHSHVLSEAEAVSYAAQKKAQHEVPLWVVLIQDDLQFKVVIHSDSLRDDLEKALIDPRLGSQESDPPNSQE